MADAESMPAKIQAQIEEMEKTLVGNPVFDAIYEKSGKAVKRVYAATGIAVVALAVIFFGFGAGLLCNLIGFVYPAYASFKAIESVGVEDDTQWLTYWVVYAFFNIMEGVADFFVSWVPFYFPIKVGFLIWLMLPQTHGAKFLYDNAIRKLFHGVEKEVDAATAEAQKALSAAQAGVGEALDKAKKATGVKSSKAD